MKLRAQVFQFLEPGEKKGESLTQLITHKINKSFQTSKTKQTRRDLSNRKTSSDSVDNSEICILYVLSSNSERMVLLFLSFFICLFRTANERYGQLEARDIITLKKRNKAENKAI